MAKEYVIGLDLGINNVGWSIIDLENKKIEDYGVKIFSISGDAQIRRSARNNRRRLKRKDTRISDLLSLFHSIGFPSTKTTDSKLIEKRVQGIVTRIEKQDIVNILCFLTSHRGYIPFGDEEVNFVDLDGKLPCEYYYQLYLKVGKYRAMDCTVKNSDLEKEILKLFSVQETYYPELKTIEDKVREIFKRKRKFWEGPGSVHSLTPYGRFQTPEQVSEYLKNKEKNSNYEKYLFEDLIGKCEISIHEKCAPKVNFYAEKFNLINDFVNLSVQNVEKLKNQNAVYLDVSKRYKFTRESIDCIFQYCITNEKVNVKNMLKQLFGLGLEDIFGYRVDRQQRPEFSTMNYYRYISKTWKDQGLDVSWLCNENVYNRIIYYLTVAPGMTEVLKMIEFDDEIDYEFHEKEANTLKEIQGKLKKEGALSYHSLSESVLRRAINDMLAYQMNFMQVRKKFDYDKEAREYFSSHYCAKKEKLPHINAKFVDDIIASPQVKKTLRQSIHLINSIIDQKKQLPKVISIESTKEMNGQERKSELMRDQAKNEKMRKNAKEDISTIYGDEFVNETNIEKVMLYKEINGQCPYCNRPIRLDDVMHGRLQVEHILPISESGNDSYENKTLSCPECNHQKSNRTPYQYLNSLGTYELYKKRIQMLKNISEEKLKNFLYEEDISKYSTRFFHRNLRDTAYATKELIHQIHIFNDYLKWNYEQKEVLTLSTPGQLTAKVRRQQNIQKDRTIGKFHHAVDACIVGAIATTPFGEILVDSQNNPKFWKDYGSDALCSKVEYITHFHLTDYKEQLSQIDSDEKIKLSYEIQKNPQQKLANSNIYKVFERDGKYYRIDQVDNIYLADFSNADVVKQFDKLFDENDSSITLLCQDNDINLFQYLKDIYHTRVGKENPFVAYCKERSGFDSENEKFDYMQYGIRVPSKKKNSPVVVRLRYYKGITTPYFLQKKSIHKKERTLLVLDSLALHCTKIYLDLDRQKFIFLPIYSVFVDLKTRRLKQDDPYYQTLCKKYIGDKKVRFITNLYSGNWLEVTKKNGTVVTGEYQTFHKTLNKIELKNGRSFTTNDLSFSLYDIDVLGNKKKRLTCKIEK